ncbi:MAG: hypothetical protein CMB61_06445 [Euryarchaeota archaeon]|nr:hypothetical protein [Euryarchaeota archaeon]
MEPEISRSDYLYDALLGRQTDELVRKIAIGAAIIGFISHIVIWALDYTEVIQISGKSSELVASPLSTLYTPFSILLTYEVYQLIRTIPDSFSSAVGKQFEIATLLVVREILKRLSEIKFSEDFTIDNDLRLLLAECAAFLALFYTSLSYHNITVNNENEEDIPTHVYSFIQSKKTIAILMLPVFLLIASISLLGWISSAQQGEGGVNREIFFLDFFTFLILADILILLISYWFYTDFGNLARNTGFILSTVIIRVAISSTGLSSMVLFALSGVIGLAIIRISKASGWNHTGAKASLPPI